MSDFITEAMSILQANGIEHGGSIDTTGQLVRCGTTDKPRSKDGAYICHVDVPASLWWKHWRTGMEGTHTAKGENTLPPAERAAFKERMEAAKAQAKLEQQKRYATAATKAMDIWESAAPANDDHTYLAKKEVPTHGLRLARDGRLIIPLRDAQGHMQSLQFIDDNNSKRFLTGGKTKGGYYPIPAANGEKDATLLICEGYSTAASLHMATGHAVLVAFNADNLEPVALMARGKYPQREIVICADNDLEGVGIPKATAAARAIGAKLAVPPAHEGKKTDFNDLHLWRTLQAVTDCVEEAAPPPTDKEEKPRLRVVNIEELLTLEVPPRLNLLDPVLPEQGLAMIFADRGVGKTFVGLHMAYAVATGGSVFTWQAQQAAKVLYVDGEMPFSAIQQRLASIVNGADIEPPDPSYLRILTPDLQGENLLPNLATKGGQEAIEPHLEGVRLLVVDNLSTLARHGRQNDEESWIPVQEWALSLRRRGISVLFVHHASKNGSQRGTSAKEDVLDVVIQLRRPHDYSTEQGARFEVHLTKARGIFGEAAAPFEAQLSIVNGKASWQVKTLEHAMLEQVRALAQDGLTMREIGEELGCSKSAVGRICKQHNIDTKRGRS